MSDNSAINWTDSTWNPVLGCTRVSPGCDSCYAISQARIRAGNPHPKVAAAFEGLTERIDGRLDWTGRVNLLPERLDQPVHWRKPRKVFVNSLADMFHKQVPDGFIACVFAVMAATPRHTYQMLTKQHGRMRALLNSGEFREQMWLAALSRGWDIEGVPWPLPNLWLGVSAEDQQWADIRIPALLRTPAEVRFVSAEPLLGPIDLRHHMAGYCLEHDFGGGFCVQRGHPGVRHLSWVICGGESGAKARPMHPAWARQIRDQCTEAGVPFWFKQHGEWIGGWRIDYDQGEAFHPVSDPAVPAWHWPGDGHPAAYEWPDGVAAMRVGTKRAGRLLDGREWSEFPVAAKAAAA